jgi:hypothetical protein
MLRQQVARLQARPARPGDLKRSLSERGKLGYNEIDVKYEKIIQTRLFSPPKGLS